MTDPLERAAEALVEAADVIEDNDHAESAHDMAQSLRALAAELRGMGWQPIETAPKDGTRVLLAIWHSLSRNHSYDVARWHKAETEHGITGWYDSGSVVYNPTHWRPLPPPPEEGAS